MSTRQDQLQSHQFAVQRVVAALVMRETDPYRSPFRRVAGATLAGVLLAAIGIGGAAAYGVVVGVGATGWRSDNALVLERESGARYLFRSGRLYPVANGASALLLGAHGEPTRVPRRSLAQVPRGAPVGIAAAPDAIPPASALLPLPWSVCSGSRPGSPSDGEQSTLLIGATPTGGEPLADRGALVSADGVGSYLLWHQRRYRLVQPRAVMRALNWSDRTVTAVAPAFLNTLPAGADLGPVRLPGSGERVPGYRARVGELFVVRGQPDQFGVLTRTGLVAVSALEAALLRLTPGPADVEPTEVTLARFNTLMTPGGLTPAGVAPPPRPPVLASVETGTLCAIQQPDGTSVLVAGGVVALSRAVPSGGRSADGAVLADQVVVTPGAGALVQAGSTLALVTEVGRRYPIPAGPARQLLGYGAVAPVRVPPGVLALLPAGPALDPTAAALSTVVTDS